MKTAKVPWIGKRLWEWFKLRVYACPHAWVLTPFTGLQFFEKDTQKYIEIPVKRMEKCVICQERRVFVEGIKNPWHLHIKDEGVDLWN